MKKTTCSILCFLLLSTYAFAQTLQKSIDDFKSKTNALVTINENSGIAEFIKFPINNPLELRGTKVYDKTISFLEAYKGVFDLNNIEKELSLGSIKTDNYGFKHVELLQIHLGVPIFDGKLKFHFNTEEKLTVVNGNYIPNLKVNPVPSLSESEASVIALQTIESQDINYSGMPLQTKESTLYIFQKGLIQGYRGANYLVYRIEVANDMDVLEFVFVNAHNGEVVEQFTGIAHALNRIVYEGNTSTTVWQEGNVFPGELSVWQKNEVVASGHTYNFFKNAFGFVSFNNDDASMRIVNNVNDPENPCPNAFFNNGTNIAYFCDGTATDDVVAHEFAHAYTNNTSGLIYGYQSGALNEAYSDIWGETIDLINNYEDDDEDLSLRTNCNSSDRWMLGEDASAIGGAIRDMWNPNCNGDPGKMTDTQYECDPEFQDQGGVHTNSGVPNHAYALLVDGGTYNGQTINSIGLTKAAHIFWRVQTEYLTQTSDFATFANALEAACADLVGVNLESLSTDEALGLSGEIITALDCAQVTNAILAVEFRTPPNCAGQTILSPLSNTLCTAATDNPIFIEDWESGLSNWLIEQLPENSGTWTPRDWRIVNDQNQTNRTGNIMYGSTNFGCPSIFSYQNGIIRLTSPIINIPDFQDGNFEMAFNHTIAMDTELDGANIKYSLDGGLWTLIPVSAFVENPYNATEITGSNNPLSGEPGFTGVNVGLFLPWGTSVVDLSSIGVLANSTIQFRFEVGTDSCDGNTGWGLDEVMVYNCAHPLSVGEFVLENVIKVFPNPSSGIFTLQKTVNVDLRSATIYDINGREIKTLNLENMSERKTIDLSSVSSGMYFVYIASADSKHVIKLFKQ